MNDSTRPEGSRVVYVPFERIGGEAPVRELVERFYDAMDQNEPELAALPSARTAGSTGPRAIDSPCS